ncbi:MAG: hypothetical protein R3F23_01975 [Verrucomicrobiia bacterium]
MEEDKDKQAKAEETKSQDIPKPPQSDKPTTTPSVDVNPKDKEIKTGWKSVSTSGDTKVEVEGGKKLNYSKDAEISGYGSIKATDKITPKAEVIGSAAFDSGKQQVKLDGQATYAASPDVKIGVGEKLAFDQAKGTVTDNTNVNASWQIDKETKISGSAGYSFIGKEADFKLDGERKFSDEWTVKNSTGFKTNEEKGNTIENTIEGKYKPNDVWDFAGKLKYSNPPGPGDSWNTTQTANVNFIKNPNKSFNMAIEHIYDINKGRTNEITGKLDYKIKDMETFIKGGYIRNGTTEKLEPSVGVGVVKHF